MPVLASIMNCASQFISQALAGFTCGSHSDRRADQIIVYAIKNETIWRQTRRSKGAANGIDSLLEKQCQLAPEIHQNGVRANFARRFTD